MMTKNETAMFHTEAQRRRGILGEHRHPACVRLKNLWQRIELWWYWTVCRGQAVPWYQRINDDVPGGMITPAMWRAIGKGAGK